MVTSSGAGNPLDELKDNLDEGKASFAYGRVSYANDKESKREKFILVVWIGSKCKVMRKAKVSLSAGCYWAWLTCGLDFGSLCGRQGRVEGILD